MWKTRKNGASARIRGEEDVSTASIAMIQDRVNEEIKNGSIIDVYRMAAGLRKACPDLGVDQIAHIVSRAVIKARGSALWERK